MRDKKLTTLTAGILLLSSVYAYNKTLIQNKETGKKMNVLFIAVDDLKPDIGCFGNMLVKTPNIDRIGKMGTVFLKSYCQQAVSGPTRASLLTGKRPDYTKIWDLKTLIRDMNPNILTIPQYFISQGYETTGVGKIFDPRSVDKKSDGASWSIPFDKNPDESYYNISTGKPAESYYQLPATKKEINKLESYFRSKGMIGNILRDSILARIHPSVENADVPDDAYTDGATAKSARDKMISLAKSSKPFFLAVGFVRPHLPFCAPKKYWDLYKRAEMPIAKFQEHAKKSPELAYHSSGELRAYSDIPSLASFTDVKVNRIGLPIEKQKELIHGYYAATSYMDAQLGKVLNTLDSLGLTSNTIIVLWGDHGWHLGDHDLWCKHSNFENATHAPLIIYSPKIKPGRTNSLAEFVDIFPTLCDLSGLDIPTDLDGESLTPLMKNPGSIVKDCAVSQFPHEGKMGYSIRSSKYRLTWWMGKGFRSYNAFTDNLVVAKELYDYEKDPLETVNVVDEKSYSKIVADLEAKMTEYFETQRKSIKN